MKNSLNAKQAAKYIGITPPTLLKAVKGGHIHALPGVRSRYSVRELDRYLDGKAAGIKG